MLTNWKTTATGTAAIFTALAAMLTQYSTGTLDANHVGVDLAGILTGLGLVFAKDHDVTGGTIRQ